MALRPSGEPLQQPPRPLARRLNGQPAATLAGHLEPDVQPFGGKDVGRPPRALRPPPAPPPRPPGPRPGGPRPGRRGPPAGGGGRPYLPASSAHRARPPLRVL